MPSATANTRISDVPTEAAVLRTPLRRAEIQERLARAARRGLLPGFAPRGQASFRVEADAVPFVHELAGAIEELPDGSEVRLTLRRLGRMPAIFVVVIALTIWPGAWLTDSLLATYWGAYGGWTSELPWLTYAWYLPLTVLPLPWAWRSLSRKSAAEAGASAAKLRRAISEILEASAGGTAS